MVNSGERVALGAFVVVAAEVARGLGIGKIVGLAGRSATVAYFDVPGEESALQINVSVAEVRVVSLPEQTRVFHRDEDTGRWQVGRIADGDGPTCLVAFPNRVIAKVPREELQVRWRKPIANPTEFLIRHVTETPLFAAARSKFVRAVTTQRCLFAAARIFRDCIVTDRHTVGPARCHKGRIGHDHQTRRSRTPEYVVKLRTAGTAGMAKRSMSCVNSIMRSPIFSGLGNRVRFC